MVPDRVARRNIDDVIGAGLLATPLEQNAPARNLGLFGACLELAASHRMTSRIGMVAEPYHSGPGRDVHKAPARSWWAWARSVH
jgi:hypothetical protein